jgi:hypothetical protein
MNADIAGEIEVVPSSAGPPDRRHDRALRKIGTGLSGTLLYRSK